MPDIEGQEPTAAGQEPNAQPQPQADPPAANPPESGQEPTKEQFDAEYVKSLRAEAAANRKRAAEAEAELKKRQDAELSESERLKRQAEEATATANRLEAELRQERARSTVAKEAAAVGLPVELAEKLVTVEWSADGEMKTDVKKTIAELVKQHPNLIPSASATATNPSRSSAPVGNGLIVETEQERRRRLLG